MNYPTQDRFIQTIWLKNKQINSQIDRFGGRQLSFKTIAVSLCPSLQIARRWYQTLTHNSE